MAYLIDKLYEIDKISKKPGFGKVPGIGLKYASPVQVDGRQNRTTSAEKKKLIDQNKKGNARDISKSNITSEEEYNSADNDDDDDKDDFACVPVNNIDNETVHIKILDDDPRHP